MPVAALFRGTEAVTMRSAFGAPRAVYVGFKGGSNPANHSHLDLGSFVLDANSVRWAVDLGADDYDAEGYWDVKEGKRWTFYRLNTQSHNTLVIGGGNQDPNASCPVIAYSPSAPHAVVDLSAAYAGHAGRVRRGIALLDGKRVLVQDEIERAKPGSPVRWAMVTPAEVTLRGNVAHLRLGAEELSAEILEPGGIKFEVLSTAAPSPEEKSNEGTRMLAVIAHPKADTALTLRVLLTPAGVSAPRPAARALADWETIDLRNDAGPKVQE
ncbi:MAG: heparinase II/III family protein [Opitutaceae bacterium]|nr:heparinase II/III family protein [Opitutaceae bacterium]